LARDLVCGMEVNEKTARYKSEHGGETYYFCNKHCKMQFDKEPEKYLNM
jgi:Cu+-exporting ATPase